jgi:benzodiazapine receptor
MRMKQGDLKSLLAAVVLPEAVGSVGGLATASSVNGWYRHILKPSWNPPSWVFAPVWTTLYLMMGIASWLVWRERETNPESSSALKFYGVQLALNAAWTPLFFGWRKIGWAALEIGVMWAAILGTAVRFYRVRPLAGFLLLPYTLWVTFATVLNATIWRLNR